MGFLDRLDEIAPGFKQIADALRGGFSEQDYERVRAYDQTYQLTAGSISTERAIEVRGRTAGYGVPAGWAEQTASEIAVIQAHEPSGAQLHAAMYRPDAPATVVYSMRVGSASGPGGELQGAPERWPLTVEGYTGLRTLGRMHKVEFAGGCGYSWTLEGEMAGFRLGRPNQSMVPVHSKEMWAPLDGGTALKIVCLAPPTSADEATEGFNTVLASWHW